MTQLRDGLDDDARYVLDSLQALPTETLKPQYQRAVRNVRSGRQVTGPLKELNVANGHLPEALWQAYPLLVAHNHRKLFGQYFTPPRVVRAALSALHEPRRILDPTMGHGAFLRGASELYPAAELCGVEIDPFVVDVGRLVLPADAAIEVGDFLEWTERQRRSGSPQWDAIVGNPPYVSYQNMNNPSGLSASDSYRRRAKQLLSEAGRGAAVDERFWKLLDDWSGYSDLSMYILAASWLNLAEGGVLSFVMTNHWMEREYGAPLVDFLEDTGRIRVIAADPDRRWFEPALVPTSILVYEKGALRSPGQHMPVIWPTTDQLNTTSLQDINSQGNIRDYNGFQNLLRRTLPREESTDLQGLPKLGWHVHQGLRTGCNGFFYAEPRDRRPVVTLDGPKGSKEFPLDDEATLVPAIRSLGPNAPLDIHAETADALLVNLNGYATREDCNRVKGWIKQYPDLEPSTMKPMSQGVERLVLEAKTWPYQSGATTKAISTLSAVAPNESTPAPGRQIPKHIRFWYQIPLRPRHFGEIIIPRVSYGPLRAYRVNQSTPIATDANFISLIPAQNQPIMDRDLLWLILNSNTFRLAAEAAGSTMGGGALKLESVQCRRIPVPIPPDPTATDLDEMTSRLAGAPLTQDELLDVGQDLDSKLLQVEDASAIRKELEAELANRRPRRRPPSTA